MGQEHVVRTLKNAIWVGPWLGGMVVIGKIGRYGGGSNLLPDWIDIAVVLVFSVAIFYWAVSQSLNKEMASKEVAKDAHQLANL